MFKNYSAVLKEGFQHDKFKIPNILTQFRLAGGVTIFLLYTFGLLYRWADNDAFRIWVLGSYLLLASTDFFDGFLARRLHQNTEYGRILDPIADGMLTLVLIPISFVYPFVVPLVMLLVARQVCLVYFMTQYGKYGKTEETVFSGKIKTAAVSVTIIFLLLPHAAFLWSYWFGMLMIRFSELITIISLVGYYLKYRDFREKM